MIVNLEGLPLPVYRSLLPTSPQLAETTPLMASVLRRLVRQPSGTAEARIWLQVTFDMGGTPVIGWVPVPQGTAEESLYVGQGCPP